MASTASSTLSLGSQAAAWKIGFIASLKSSDDQNGSNWCSGKTYTTSAGVI